MKITATDFFFRFFGEFPEDQVRAKQSSKKFAQIGPNEIGQRPEKGCDVTDVSTVTPSRGDCRHADVTLSSLTWTVFLIRFLCMFLMLLLIGFEKLLQKMKFQSENFCPKSFFANFFYSRHLDWRRSKQKKIKFIKKTLRDSKTVFDEPIFYRPLPHPKQSNYRLLI